MRGGVELNPGPRDELTFEFGLVSQNCRGLTDQRKLANILRSLYAFKGRSENKVRIACLQETHQIDGFTANLWFIGKVLSDDGERNQRGVCILIPEGFELRQSKVSGMGRWAIAVVSPKGSGLSRSLVVVNVYAPNCHREAIGFFQELFVSLDEVTDELVAQNVAYDIACTGDFNAVLQFEQGASNRATSRTERDLALVVGEATEHRNLIEPGDLCKVNCHTWRRGTCLSKLDYVFLSRNLIANVKAANIRWHEHGSKLDHAAVSVQVAAAQATTRGRSFPKLFKSDISKEADIRWMREQLLQSENQIPNHWNPHMKLEFMKTMLRSKTLELRQMNKYVDNSAAIRDEINATMKNVPLSAAASDKLEALKLRLAELEDIEAESLRIRAGVRWREEGEKSTAYILARFKARTDAAIMHSIRLLDRIVRGSKDISLVVKLFYQNLYEEKQLNKLDDADFCDNFFANCPTLVREHKLLLAKPMDLGELKESLRSCKDSAPGLDGIPYSFFTTFHDILPKYILDSWNYALQRRELSESHRRSCISLLPKQGKDLSVIGNWRPISLSACDLKIVTKAYANRLKKVLPDILDESQAAYVPGRDISLNNRIIQSARRYSVKNRLDFCLVSVSHKYLVKVLEAYEFPDEFIKVFRTLYSGLSSVVQVNGFLSEQFSVRRGVKQGDALSCGLFVLPIDPLLRNLSQNHQIEGLAIPTSATEAVDIKVLSYADDVAIICRNASLQQIFSEYERFGKMSGLILNADKTKVFNFCQSPNRLNRVSYMGKDCNLGRVEAIRICGIWLAEATPVEYKHNVLDKITAMEAKVLGWGRRHLSLVGRMTIAKTFLLSLIVFPAQVVKINKPEIEKLIYSFVNGANNLYGPERISRSNLKAPKDRGGIDGIDVDSFVKSLAVKQFEKAARTHRKLGSLQGIMDYQADDIAGEARAALRTLSRMCADSHSMPDLEQPVLISGIPLVSLLIPTTNAAKFAAQENMSNLGQLQFALVGRRRIRSKILAIMRALPKPFAALIRRGVLIQAPSKLVWFSNEHIKSCESVTTKEMRTSLLSLRVPNLGVKLGKIYKPVDWPPLELHGMGYSRTCGI